MTSERYGSSCIAYLALNALMSILLRPPLSALGATSACNQQNKQKATYHHPVFSPTLSSSNALDISWDVIWHDLEDLRSYGSGGMFVAHMVRFRESGNGGYPSGYAGPQVKGDTRSGKDQMLFSLWDKNPGDDGDAWRAAMPWPGTYGDRSVGGCYRNCQDCAVHTGPNKAPDGSTGTQCKILYPSAYSGQIIRFRMRRYLRNQQVEMYNRTWTGDVWEVTYRELTGANPDEEVLIGRQLLHGVSGDATGQYSSSFFREFLGCNLCEAYASSASTRGPWIAMPSHMVLRRDTSRYALRNDTYTCVSHNISSPEPGVVRWYAGPNVRVGTPDGTWDKTLYTCTDGDEYCHLPEPAARTTTTTATLFQSSTDDALLLETTTVVSSSTPLLATDITTTATPFQSITDGTLSHETTAVDDGSTTSLAVTTTTIMITTEAGIGGEEFGESPADDSSETALIIGVIVVGSISVGVVFVAAYAYLAKPSISSLTDDGSHDHRL